MSTGRIDVIADAVHDGIYLNIESFDGTRVFDLGSSGDEGNIADASLTVEEARYLRDELAGAIEKHESGQPSAA